MIEMQTQIPAIIESHAVRVLRLRREFESRYEHYRLSHPELKTLLDKLMLKDPQASNNLSPAELDCLDQVLDRVRLIRERFRKIPYFKH